MALGSQLLSARSVRWLDVGVVVWIVVWVVLGVLVWQRHRRAGQLSPDVIKVGSAVQDTGRGARCGRRAPAGRRQHRRVRAQDREAGRRGGGERAGQPREHRRAAVIAGIAVGVLPAAMVLLVYVPVRLRWRRSSERRGGAPRAPRRPGVRAVPGAPRDRRAAVGRPARRHARPVARRGRGDFRALADAELERLGLRRP